MLLVVFLKFSPQKTDNFRFLQIEKITSQSRNMVFLRLLEKSSFFSYFVHIHPIHSWKKKTELWNPENPFFPPQTYYKLGVPATAIQKRTFWHMTHSWAQNFLLLSFLDGVMYDHMINSVSKVAIFQTNMDHNNIVLLSTQIKIKVCFGSFT